jgi:hypothetical protein
MLEKTREYIVTKASNVELVVSIPLRSRRDFHFFSSHRSSFSFLRLSAFLLRFKKRRRRSVCFSYTQCYLLHGAIIITTIALPLPQNILHSIFLLP